MTLFSSRNALMLGLLLVSGPAFANTNSFVSPGSNLDAVLDSRGNPVLTSTGDCVRTTWMGGNAACGGSHEVISLEARTVYFEFNKAALTPEAMEKLNSLAGLLKSDTAIKSVGIAGFADRIGSAKYNEALSEKRAKNVRDYLAAQGVANVHTTKTRWFGKTEPRTNCPAKLSRQELIDCLAADRRVEVEVVYQTTEPGPAAASPHHHHHHHNQAAQGKGQQPKAAHAAANQSGKKTVVPAAPTTGTMGSGQ